MIAGAVALVAGAVYTGHAFTLPMGTAAQPGAAVFPLVVGSATLLISVLTIAEARFTTKAAGAFERPAVGRGKYMLGMAGAIAGYLLLLPFLGQYLASALFGAVAVRLLRGGPSWRAALFGALLALVISYVFLELLGVRLPAGLWTGM